MVKNKTLRLLFLLHVTICGMHWSEASQSNYSQVGDRSVKVIRKRMRTDDEQRPLSPKKKKKRIETDYKPTFLSCLSDMTSCDSMIYSWHLTDNYVVSGSLHQSPDPEKPFVEVLEKMPFSLLGEEAVEISPDKSFEEIYRLYNEIFLKQHQALLEEFCQQVGSVSINFIEEQVGLKKKDRDPFDSIDWEFRKARDEFFWQVRDDIKILPKISGSYFTQQEYFYFRDNFVQIAPSFEELDVDVQNAMLHFYKHFLKFYTRDYLNLMAIEIDRIQDRCDLSDDQKADVYAKAKDIVTWYSIFSERRAAVAAILDLYKSRDQGNVGYKLLFPLDWRMACDLYDQKPCIQSSAHCIMDLKVLLEKDRMRKLVCQVNSWLAGLKLEEFKESEEQANDDVCGLDVETQALEFSGALDSARDFQDYHNRLAGVMMKK